MSARSTSLLLLLLVSTLLSGCWDRTEINDMAFILTSAIDLEKDGKIRYTVMLPLPGQMGGATGGGGGGGSNGGKSYYIDSEVGETYRECHMKLQKRMSRRMFLAHRRTILVGEDLARQGIRELFDTVPRSPESRMTTFLVVTKGKAYDMMNSTPKFEHFPSEAIRELIKSKSVMDINFKDFGISLSLPGADPVAVYMDVKDSEQGVESSKEVELKGYAQFRHDKMVGTLENDAAMGLSIINGQKMISHSITLQMGDGQIMSARIYEALTNINTKLINQKLEYDIALNIKATLMEDTSHYDLSQTKNILLVEDGISKKVKSAVQDVINQSLKNNVDSCEFGNFLWRAYPGEWKSQFEKNWPESLKDAKFNIQVQSQLTDTGLIFDNVTRERITQ
ncbi:Ger(x)C family spore germination protein [Paenibacillus sp. FSL H7-0331]|uniref:Ger(x)C family spore germination protein n=1 Tax=Paenibacillus sp. FSL H7-0331 TaxID=1920421 RepID=UPI00096E1587|nr:Ger(x)C family spore germination protein [Paenibacillus sp. FSL H7-0331]OMF16121.1 spore gernimation protein [Paenibacillus sp. FSL H7-0331]